MAEYPHLTDHPFWAGANCTERDFIRRWFRPGGPTRHSPYQFTITQDGRVFDCEGNPFAIRKEPMNPTLNINPTVDQIREGDIVTFTFTHQDGTDTLTRKVAYDSDPGGRGLYAGSWDVSLLEHEPHYRLLRVERPRFAFPNIPGSVIHAVRDAQGVRSEWVLALDGKWHSGIHSAKTEDELRERYDRFEIITTEEDDA